MEDLILSGKICPYCERTPAYVDSSVVYGTSYGMIYFCGPCDAWVGVHKGTDVALGRLADAELRTWKKRAHAAFDQIWRQKKEEGMGHELARKWTYGRLSHLMQLPAEKTHIGMFDIEQCKKVIDLSEDPGNWEFAYGDILEGVRRWADKYRAT